MSYSIIKSISIKDDEVYITSACSNVYPRSFQKYEETYFTKILQEKGKEAVETEILRAYEEGGFQGGNNKYVRALKVLRKFPEYANFDWRESNTKDNRETPAFNEILLRALNTRLPKDKFIITKIFKEDGNRNDGAKIYGKKTSTKMHWSLEKSFATIYHYKEDAEEVKGKFNVGKNWKVEQLLNKEGKCV